MNNIMNLLIAISLLILLLASWFLVDSLTDSKGEEREASNIVLQMKGGKISLGQIRQVGNTTDDKRRIIW